MIENLIEKNIAFLQRYIQCDEETVKVYKYSLRILYSYIIDVLALMGFAVITNKIIETISLKKLNITPELSHAINDFTLQMQMAQIAEQIQVINFAIEEVKQGQEYDRLATAYSCQQKLLQIMSFNNKDLKTNALMNLALDAEDSRNLLMKSQMINLDFIKKQPESLIGKFLSGSKQEEIDNKISQIRESFNATNMVSLVEAIAYQEIGEDNAAKKSLDYYNNFR